MPIALPNFDFSRPWLRLVCSLLLFGLTLYLGLWVLYNSHMQTLERQSKESAQRAVALLEIMLSHAQDANQALEPLLGKPCEQALPAMRQQAALVPFVRTVNLLSQGVVYCNSLSGAVHWSFNREAYVDGRLRLASGSQVRADHPVLLLKSSQELHGAVVSSIDGDYLHLLLRTGDNTSRRLLHVGDQWLDDEQVLSNGAVSLPTLASHQVFSSRYPFAIYAGHDMSSLWPSLWQEKQWVILLLTGFSLGLALCIWWLLGRPRSPISELERALRNEEFVPYLQPLVVSESRRVMGAEVLMRWHHPTAGVIRPDLFIPQAEESGLIVPMTALAMKEVARSLGKARQHIPHGFHIGFNISSAHCNDMGLLAECRSFLAHFAPGQVVLVLELTERELLVATPQTLSLFKQLNELGVQLAIDDFGTGHSSLAYLQQFQVDYLKIDQSFVSGIGTESLSQHIVDNVIDLAIRLDLALVAEGVESEHQADYLRAKGVDYLQGYLFARPMPLRQFCEEQLPEEAQSRQPDVVCRTSNEI
ncbi:EAL domain-containing protein [Aeromonas fluvialis]|uniref:EAL domain-containing protein n=1 Tax=Aeromonas fluvialis TaxID=591962 RepID=UPI0005AA9C60|nr:cyclic diguanylate phosphodiesterase [Aeromonas fluvialis]